MSTSPISPCPFCASKHGKLTELDVDGWAVICDSCGGIGPVGHSAEDSIDQWNMRLALARNLGLTHGEN
jgi:Lar family restriction alleviation protein